MALPAFFMNIMFWIWSTVGCVIVIIMFTILLVLMKIFTHGFTELKAKFTGKPICMFFEDSRYLAWKVIKPEAGMIEDKDYGHFLINEQGSYIDRDTKNVYISFDAGFASSASAKAFKITDDLYKVIRDERMMNEVRSNLMMGRFDGKELEGLRESINFSHLKSLSNTLLPHNITAKIQMTIQQKMAEFGKVNSGQIIMMFVAVFGAIIIGYLLLRMMK